MRHTLYVFGCAYIATAAAQAFIACREQAAVLAGGLGRGIRAARQAPYARLRASPNKYELHEAAQSDTQWGRKPWRAAAGGPAWSQATAGARRQQQPATGGCRGAAPCTPNRGGTHEGGQRTTRRGRGAACGRRKAQRNHSGEGPLRWMTPAQAGAHHRAAAVLGANEWPWTVRVAGGGGAGGGGLAVGEPPPLQGHAYPRMGRAPGRQMDERTRPSRPKGNVRSWEARMYGGSRKRGCLKSTLPVTCAAARRGRSLACSFAGAAGRERELTFSLAR
jgi:hypothetical protein